MKTNYVIPTTAHAAKEGDVRSENIIFLQATQSNALLNKGFMKMSFKNRAVESGKSRDLFAPRLTFKIYLVCTANTLKEQIAFALPLPCIV